MHGYWSYCGAEHEVAIERAAASICWWLGCGGPPSTYRTVAYSRATDCATVDGEAIELPRLAVGALSETSAVCWVVVVLDGRSEVATGPEIVLAAVEASREEFVTVEDDPHAPSA